jgi:1-phosphatidylinositol phosphodiesterase
MYRIQMVIRATLLVAIGFTTADANGGGTSFTAKPRRITTEKYSSWMSRLPDTVLVSRTSLPGTHDSCALHDGLSFGFAKCQTWQLADQLQAGIRFIDIRCRHVGDNLLIYHGVIDQRTTFTEVRDVCRKFLMQHPSECIVMSVKEESTAKDNSRSFAETFVDTTKNDGKLWHVSRKIPQLGSVRNRIVLVDRVGTLGGLKWGDMEIQDRSNATVELKAKLIRSHFEKASNAGESQWFINFCSGTVPGSLMTPRQYALQANEVALEFLRQPDRPVPACLGTIVMDFPGEELIEQIVETNFAHDKAN